MINADMFKNTVPQRQPQPQQPPFQPVYVQPQQPPQQPQPYYPQPVLPTPRPYVAPDPEAEKLRLTMMKLLFWIVGGAALLLIVWRVILKFI